MSDDKVTKDSTATETTVAEANGSATLAKKQPRVHYAWFIFAGCCCMMAGGLGAVLNSCGVFYVPVCEELGFGRSEIAFYLTCYFLAMVVTIPFVGNLLPRVNIRILMTCMFICVCLAEGLMSVYTELWQWYASGVVFGICGSFIFILPTPVLIGNWFKKRTGLVLGIAMSFSGIGTAIFSPLFTNFITIFGWRTTYIIVACIMAVLVLPWTAFVFRFRPADMGLLPYGATAEEVAAAEDEEKNPSKKKSAPGVAIKAAVFSVPFVCIFVLGGCDEFFGGLTNHIASYAESIGEAATFGATLLSIISIGNVIIKLCVGALADKIGIVKTCYVQMAIVIAACSIFTLTTAHAALFCAAFLLGVSNSVVTMSEPLLVRHFFGEKNYSAIYSYIRVGGGLVGSLGPVVVGFVYDTTGAYTLAFVIGICIALGLACAVFIASRFQHRLVWEE